MFNFKKVVPVMAIAILCTNSLHGQGEATRTVSITPPTAAALTKYVDYPVNYHTGTPEISFPLYTVKDGSLSLPITLSYHAAGLKVMEHASWVGAGFSLLTGGVVTRSLRGYADERRKSAHAYLQEKGYYNYLYNQDGNLDYSTFSDGDKDGEPDLFFFNFNGYSGKFYFHPDGTPVFLPQGDIRVQPLFCPGPNTGCSTSQEYLYGWIFTTPDGTQYHFGKTIDVTTDQDAVETLQTFSPSAGLSNSVFFSSWYLHKIVSADGLYQIALTYAPEEYAYYSVSTYPVNVGYSGGNITGLELIKNKIKGIRLSTITYGGNTITFEPGSVREDLSRFVSDLIDYDNQQSKALGAILIQEGDLCKRYVFNYSYFNSTKPLPSMYGTGLANLATVYNLHTSKKRLKLNSFYEVSCSTTDQVPAHVFSYYDETNLPATISLAQDHWGFYNGADGNTELIPSLSKNGGVSFTEGSGANREAAWPAMRAGALQRVTYPTGGNVEFNYLNHSVFVPRVPSYLGWEEKPVGGLRIENMVANTAPGVPAKVTSYVYVNENDEAQGVLYSKPNYIALVRNDRIGQSGVQYGTNSYFLPPNGCLVPGIVGSATGHVISPGSIHPMMTTQGNHFGYNEVKVVQADGGYTIYKYTSQGNQGDVSVRIVNVNACDATAPNFPAAPQPHNFYRGLLRRVTTYNSAGKKLTEKIIDPTYTMEAGGVDGLIIKEYAGYRLATEYRLKTGRKTFEREVNIAYSPNSTGTDATPYGTVKETSYSSSNHPYATREVVSELLDFTNNVPTEGEILDDTRYKYVADFQTPSNFPSISYCEQIKPEGCDDLLIADEGTEWDDYVADVSACGTLACRFSRWQAYALSVNNRRKSYVNSCRITNTTARAACDQVLWGYSSASAELKALLDMKTQNNRGAVVEVSHWRKARFLGSSFVTYQMFDSDRKHIYPGKLEVSERAVPGGVFTAAFNTATEVTRDVSYREKERYVFIDGTLSEMISSNGTRKHYRWGYNNRYPIADITKPGPGGLTYYNNFETTGTVGDAVSGQRYWNSGSYTLNSSYPTDGITYKMSYWYWQNNAWHFSGELPYTLTISRGSRLDDIRVYPEGTQFVTYDYSRGKGIRSSIDVNGTITRYEYDDLGRLTTVRDGNNDITNQYEYSYYKSQN